MEYHSINTVCGLKCHGKKKLELRVLGILHQGRQLGGVPVRRVPIYGGPLGDPDEEKYGSIVKEVKVSKVLYYTLN